MNTPFLSLSSKPMRALAAAVALMAGGSAFAQSESNAQQALNLYGGIQYGFQVRGGCDGADTCERARDAFKLFGGYRITPNLATEVSYWYLGKQERVWGAGNPDAPNYTTVEGTQQVRYRINRDETRTDALGLGVNYESEIFDVATNHLRVGLAVSRAKRDYSLETGGVRKEEKNRVFPYVGVGISVLATPRIRFFTGADVLINPDQRFWVLTVGAGGDF